MSTVNEAKSSKTPKYALMRQLVCARACKHTDVTSHDKASITPPTNGSDLYA